MGAAAVTVILVGALRTRDPPAQAPPVWLQASSERLPPPRQRNLGAAVRAARCIVRRTDPPSRAAAGRPPAASGVYLRLPQPSLLAGALTRGGLVVSFKASLPRRRLAQLRALYDEAPAGVVLGPGGERRSVVTVVARTRTLACPTFADGLFDAVRAFRAQARVP